MEAGRPSGAEPFRRLRARKPATIRSPKVLEPVQRRIERSLLHIEDVARHLLDACGDSPAA